MKLPETDQALEREIVTLCWLAALVRVTTLGALAAAVGLPAFLGGGRLPPFAWIVLAGATLMGLPALVRLATAGVRYRRFRFGVSDAFLRVRHGWLARHEKVIPVPRVQHLDVDEGFFERLFGLATLEVYTAGGRRATFRIPGLTPERARGLRRRILAASEGEEAGEPPADRGAANEEPPREAPEAASWTSSLPSGEPGGGPAGEPR